MLTVDLLVRVSFADALLNLVEFQPHQLLEYTEGLLAFLLQLNLEQLLLSLHFLLFQLQFLLQSCIHDPALFNMRRLFRTAGAFRLGWSHEVVNCYGHHLHLLRLLEDAQSLSGHSARLRQFTLFFPQLVSELLSYLLSQYLLQFLLLRLFVKG